MYPSAPLLCLKKQQRVNEWREKATSRWSIFSFVYTAIQFAAIVVSDTDRVGLSTTVARQPGHCVLCLSKLEASVLWCIARACCKRFIRTVVVLSLHCVKVHVFGEIQTLQKRKRSTWLINPLAPQVELSHLLYTLYTHTPKHIVQTPAFHNTLS